MSDSWAMIRLEGEVGVGSAAEIKSLLLEALTSGQGVQLRIEGCAELDVTILQLLLATEREAARRGVAFAYAAPASEPLAETIAAAGLTPYFAALCPK